MVNGSNKQINLSIWVENIEKQRYKQGRCKTENWKSVWSSAKTSTNLGCQGHPTHNNKLNSNVSLCCLSSCTELKLETLEKEDENRLLVFEMMCLRKILGVSLLHKICNNRIRQSLDLNYNIIDPVNHKSMRLFEHMQIINSTRHPKILTEANINEKRPKGKPAKRWTDCIKDSCRAQKSDINLSNGKDGYGQRRMVKHHGPDGKAEWTTRADAVGQGRFV